MPIKARMADTLTGQESAPLLDPTNALHRVLPEEPDPALPLISRIDWYDTVEFTPGDIPGLLGEIDMLMGRVNVESDLRYLKELRGFVESCRANPRCLLRFIGD